MSVFNIKLLSIFRIRLWAPTRQSICLFSDEYNSSDDDDDNNVRKKKPVVKEQSEKLKKDTKQVTATLNQLLSSMTTDSSKIIMESLVMAKSKKKEKDEVKKQMIKQVDDDRRKSDVIHATKKVAESLGGDKKVIESELLSKLLMYSIESKNIDDKQQLNQSNQKNISDLMRDMKVDKSQSKSTPTRSDFVKRTASEYQDRHVRQQRRQSDKQLSSGGSVSHLDTKVDLFGGENLGIFKNPDELKQSDDILNVWNKFKQREIQLSVTHPPANYFQKFALWTDQGKLWKFPIDNEQGLDDEQKIYFTDHVFMQQYVESWCPKTGPIAHFMHLVCVGLSKNPYLTVAEKKDHILWFKDYFDKKKELLQDIIIDSNTSVEKEKNA